MSEPTPNKPAAPTAVQAPPMPAKPAAAPPPAKPAAKKGADRRFFLFTWIGLAWTTFSLSMLGMVLGTVRFLFPNVLSEPPSTFKAGDPNGYEEGKVVERYKEQNA